jgi:hypothetical protein
MNLKEIKGLLVTENMAAVRNIDARRALFAAFSENKIRHLIKFQMGRNQVGFQIDHAQLIEGTHDEAFSFIQALDQVIQSEAAGKFNFTGEFTVNIETEKETIAFLVTVKECKVSYQEIEYLWPDTEQN